jgi:hypothetical protein
MFIVARSRHTSGVVAALVDSSVHFIADDIDALVYRAYGSRAAQETVPAL